MRSTALALALCLAACGRTDVVRYSEFPPDASIIVPPLDAGQPDAGRPDAGMPDAGPCVPRPVPLVPALPTVMFVIDRSGSMLEDLDGNLDAGVTRWRVLQSSLRTVLPPVDSQIAFGALMYPLHGTSCTTPSSVDLSPTTNAATRLLGLFDSPTPLGGTPTADALTVASQHLLSLRTATSARAMILATDGAPNCNPSLPNRFCTCTSPPSSPNSNCDAPTHCLDDVRTVQSLAGLFRGGLPTYVIGLGSQLNMFATTLDQMAVAGGVPRMGAGPRYYPANNQAELTAAFSRITSQLTRCTFLLNGLSANDTFVVNVGGADIPEGPGGWEWLDQANGELALRGVACDAAANGATARVLVDCH